MQAMTGSSTLTVTDHDRDSAGMIYIYPVISRRAGGVSVGVNLNPNNACNWRCLYCQVPGLTRGSAPPVDMARLGNELRAFLRELLHGDFMQRRVPEGMRRINDIALSGNGEPTSTREFEQVIELIGGVMAEFGLTGKIKLALITNGSLIHRGNVQRGLKRMAALNGEVWFKLDSATPEGMRRINGTRATPATVRDRLCTAARLCPTWLQTCVFALDGLAPDETERRAYLSLLASFKREDVPLKGVLLYGLARPSMQPGAQRLSALPCDWLQSFAAEIGALGFTVKVSC
jgi:wyosine [tRNA(Phe)-imidazoG37] synthetase (radical SAM superfamily)